MFFLWAVADNGPAPPVASPVGGRRRRREERGELPATVAPQAVGNNCEGRNEVKSQAESPTGKKCQWGESILTRQNHQILPDFYGFYRQMRRTAICRYTIYFALFYHNSFDIFPATVVVRYIEMENTSCFSDQRTQTNTTFVTENTLCFYINQTI